jgi:hypothetical protein
MANSSVAQLEKVRLRRGVFGIPKVAKTDADQPIALLCTQIYSLALFQRHLGNSSQEEGGQRGVWLRVRTLNSPVFSFRTTERAVRDLYAKQTRACRLGVDMGSVSANGTSRSKVSSTDIDRVGRCGTTSLSSIPGASSCKRNHSGRTGVRAMANPAFVNLPPSVLQAWQASPQ